MKVRVGRSLRSGRWDLSQPLTEMRKRERSCRDRDKKNENGSEIILFLPRRFRGQERGRALRRSLFRLRRIRGLRNDGLTCFLQSVVDDAHANVPSSSKMDRLTISSLMFRFSSTKPVRSTLLHKTFTKRGMPLE